MVLKKKFTYVKDLFIFLLKKLRKSTNNHLLNNSTGKIMKNIENDNNLLENCNRFYLLLRETDGYEVIEIRNITSKCAFPKIYSCKYSC
jgi:hypothetical protein